MADDPNNVNSGTHIRSFWTGPSGASVRNGNVTMPYVLELLAGPIIINGSPPYQLNPATNTTLGGVIIPDGGNLAIDAGGHLTMTGQYLNNSTANSTYTYKDRSTDTQFVWQKQGTNIYPSIREDGLDNTGRYGNIQWILKPTGSQYSWAWGGVSLNTSTTSLTNPNLDLYVNYSDNFGAGNAYGRHLKITPTDVTLSTTQMGSAVVPAKVWTTDSILTQGYADTRYIPKLDKTGSSIDYYNTVSAIGIASPTDSAATGRFVYDDGAGTKTETIGVYRYDSAHTKTAMVGIFKESAAADYAVRATLLDASEYGLFVQPVNGADPTVKLYGPFNEKIEIANGTITFNVDVAGGHHGDIIAKSHSGHVFEAVSDASILTRGYADTRYIPKVDKTGTVLNVFQTVNTFGTANAALATVHGDVISDDGVNISSFHGTLRINSTYDYAFAGVLRDMEGDHFDPTFLVYDAASSGHTALRISPKSGDPVQKHLIEAKQNNSFFRAGSDASILTRGYADTRYLFTPSVSTLTYAAHVAWAVNHQKLFTLTLTGDAVLDDPVNPVAGATYNLIVKQDGTGGRKLTYGTSYKFPGGVKPALSMTANAVDVLTFIYDGTNMIGLMQKDFR